MGVGVKLTEFSKSAGCAAKIGPGVWRRWLGDCLRLWMKI